MKKFMISLAIASFAMISSVNAQEVNEIVVPTKKNSVVTNNFGSNWFIGVNGGVNLYNGVVTKGENPFKHLTPALNVYVGKWHTPGFGWRVAYQGLNVQAYENNDHTTFMNFHADMLFNLSNLICGYNEERIWNFIPYIGVGWAGRDAYSHEDFDGLTGSISANYGIINTFRVAKHWAINLELNGAFFRNGFGGCAGSQGHDMMWSAQVGVTYKFNKVGWDAAVDVPALQGIYGAAINELVNDLDNAKAENAQLKKDYKALSDKYNVLKDEYEKLKNKPCGIAPAQSVFFAFGSAKIDSKKEIMNIEAYAKAAAEAGIKLVVTGYTDTIGSEAYNKTLAEKRANAVADILKKAGVQTEIKIVPFGETSECKQKYLNRRAIIEIQK
jgi:outer membrane protein OmpA-like peptidoglycan-associated protein